MSQLRHDPLSGVDVIVAAGRAARPVTFAPRREADTGLVECPFCPGNEAETPPEVARVGGGDPNGPGWMVRAFPNLYPIVDAHEVVVLSPDHDRSFADLDDEEAVAVVRLLRDRVRELVDAGHAFGFAIVNHLREAGASIAHPHAQVFALDVVPRAVEEALARTAAAGVDLVEVDRAGDDLVVVHASDVTVWCPRASGSKYLLRVSHADAAECFDLAPDAVVDAVAVALRDTLRRLRALLGDAPYNVVVHTAPRHREPFHWYVEVTPRISVIAGFEQATGVLVNTVPPEDAAVALRAVSID
jgi:UDPglucose--hexose-1-phosphate uridylyltransferase